MAITYFTTREQRNCQQMIRQSLFRDEGKSEAESRLTRAITLGTNDLSDEENIPNKLCHRFCWN